MSNRPNYQNELNCLTFSVNVIPLAWSHGEADLNKFEIRLVVQQQEVRFELSVNSSMLANISFKG